MSIAAKEAVTRFITEAWNAGDARATDELIHPDYEIRGIGRGPEAVRRNMAIYRTAFPDLEWVIEQLVAEGEWVAARLTLRGTHLGPLGGIPPSGRSVTLNELVFWRVVDGKLHTIWSQGDSLGLRIQIGALPVTAWQHPVPTGPEDGGS
jgi:steroid delta-isomerase-like uncharacterized protein